VLIPALAALFPGTAAGGSGPAVLSAGPGLVDVQVHGAGWAETLPELGVLAAWCVGLFVVGWLVLKRRVQAL